MYSLRMSFWVVPEIRSRGDPLGLGRGHVQRQQDGRGRVDRHRGADVPERQAVDEDRHVGEAADRDADPAHLAFGRRGVRVVAHLRGQVERDRQAGLAVVQEVPEPAVRLLGGREPRVLAHGPEAAAIHRGLDPAGERVLARSPEVTILVETLEVRGRVEVAHLDPGRRLEPLAALRSRLPSPCPERLAPSVTAWVRPLPYGASRPLVGLAHPRTTRTSPSSTVAPAPAGTRVTVPARGARSSFCIFMASTASRV